jgi:hypothetical protein
MTLNEVPFELASKDRIGSFAFMGTSISRSDGTRVPSIQARITEGAIERMIRLCSYRSCISVVERALDPA